MWQDYAFTVASFMFGYSLIPQLIKNYIAKSAEQISWQLMLGSLVALGISAVSCFTLKLYLTTAMNCIQMMCWSVMIYQKIHYAKHLDDKAKE